MGIPSFNQSLPTIADPNQVANQQQMMNANFTNFLNNINTQNAIAAQAGSQYQSSTPFGSTNYFQYGTGPGGVPLYGVNQSLDATGQQLLNQYRGNQGYLGGLPQQYAGLGQANMDAAGTTLGTFMDVIPPALLTSRQAGYNLDPAYGLVGQASGMIPGAADTLSGAAAMAKGGPDLWPMIQQTLSGVPEQLDFYKGKNADQTIGSATTGNTRELVGHMTDYYEPFFNQQSDRLDNQLRNQGFAPGTPGFDNAMGNNQKSQNAEVGKAIAQFEPIAYQQAYQNFMTPLALGTGMANVGGTEGGIAQNLASSLGTQVGAMTGVGKAQADIASQLSGMGYTSAQISGLLNEMAKTQGGLASAGGSLVNTQTGLADVLNKAVASMMGLSAPTMPQQLGGPALQFPTAVGQPGSIQSATAVAQQGNQQNFANLQGQQQNFLSGISGLGSKLLPLIMGG